MLWAYLVVYTKYHTLKVAKSAFYAICMEYPAGVFI